MEFIFSLPKCYILISVAIYAVILYFFDCRQLSDERRELIRLKALRFSQKFTTYALLLIAIINFFVVSINSELLLGILILTALYSELVAKIYFDKIY